MSSDANLAKGSGVPAHVWHRWVGRGVFFLSAIMCLYLVATIWSAHGNLTRAIEQLPLGTLPAILALIFLGWALRAGRWHYYVRLLRWKVPWHHSLLAFLASFAFTATPGKAGEVVKSVLLRTRYDVPLADGMGVLLVERLGDLLAVLVLAVGGLALLADSLVYFLAAALLVIGMTVFASSRRIYTPVLSRMAKLPKLSGLVNKLLRLLNTGEALLRPAGLSWWVWASPWLPGAVRAGRSTSSSVVSECRLVFSASCSIYGIATLVGALSALPGGLGSFEVVMVLLLSRLGMPVAAATLPVVLFRLCSLWLGSLAGLIAMVAWFSWIVPSDGHKPSGDAL